MKIYKLKNGPFVINFFHVRTAKKGQCFIVRAEMQNKDGHACSRRRRPYQLDVHYVWKYLLRHLPKKTLKLLRDRLDQDRDHLVV